MQQHALTRKLTLWCFLVVSFLGIAATLKNPEGGPILAVTGDSISVNAQHAADLFTLSMTNFGAGGMPITNVVTQLPAIAACHAQVIIIHGGIIDTGVATWADRLPALNTMRAGLTNTVIMDEVTPFTGADDARAARVRDWNTNLRLWAATNNVHVTIMHDQFGQLRVSTGLLDDLLLAYDSGDGLHPSVAGYTAMDVLWSNAFFNVYIPIPTISALTVKAGSIRQP